MSTSADDRRRARAVAAVVSRLAGESGRDLAGDLLIWRLAGGRGACTEPAGAGADLARTLEEVTGEERRRRTGLHVTPRWLADELVALGLDGVGSGDPCEPSGPDGRIGAGGGALTDRRTGGRRGTGGKDTDARGTDGLPAVCDPACGGGAFLLAAAEALAARGVPRVDVVRRALWGADIDPVGLAAAEAALALWAGEPPPAGRLVVADPLRSGAAAWQDAPGRGFDLVVGNPPFQSQLDRTTARAAADRTALRDRFGGAMRAYTDTAWLFLLLGCEIAAPGGRVVLVQPQSLVAARDAEAVRRALDDRARLLRLWVERQPVFGAAVRVCAPVLEATGRAAPGTAPAPDAAPGSRGASAAGSPGEDAWRDGLAAAIGLPRVSPRAAGRLGDRAQVIAGFRDEYYGMTDLVREARARERRVLLNGRGDVAASALVTSGAIGWSATTWGTVPVRYARRRWAAPVVDLEVAAGCGSRAARRWIARTSGPKVLVASQTRVLEAVVDGSGRWVPSVPVVALVPREPDDVWLLAAAVLAPAATAWLARCAPGTALARDAIRVAAPDLAALPLPGDPGAWREAADLLRELSGGSVPGEAATRPAAPSETVTGPAAAAAGRSQRVLLGRFVEAAAAAYGLGPEGDAVVRWWHGRLPADVAATGPAERADGRRACATG
ncbi:MAG TPA: N-6 DNA methylase [Acidimicrobiales bacterium]